MAVAGKGGAGGGGGGHRNDVTTVNRSSSDRLAFGKG